MDVTDENDGSNVVATTSHRTAVGEGGGGGRVKWMPWQGDGRTCEDSQKPPQRIIASTDRAAMCMLMVTRPVRPGRPELEVS